MEITRDNCEFVSEVISEIVDWLDMKGLVDWETGVVNELDDCNLETISECWNYVNSSVVVSWTDFQDIWKHRSEMAAECNDLDITMGLESLQKLTEDKSDNLNCNDVEQFIDSDPERHFDSFVEFISIYYSKKHNISHEEVKKQVNKLMLNCFDKIDEMYEDYKQVMF